MTPEPGTSPRISPQSWFTAITYLVILTIFLIINIRMASPYILSILMGAIMALLLVPFYRRLLRFKLRPYYASAFVTVGLALIIVIPLSLFAIAAVNQAVEIGQSIVQNGEFSIRNLMDKVTHWRIYSLLPNDFEIREEVIGVGKKGLESTTNLLLSIVKGIPDKALLIALSLLSCFFFLVDGRRFLIFLFEKFQLDSDVRTNLQVSFKDTAISVIWATVAAASVQSIIMVFSFLVLNIPGAFLAGGATFIFAWIPFVGAGPVWLTGSLYLFVQDRIAAMVAMLVLGMFTSLIDNYIRPLILKGRNELHPLVSLVAIFGGIQMFGLFGVFFGPVFAAGLISLLQILPTVASRVGLKFSTISPNSNSDTL